MFSNRKHPGCQINHWLHSAFSYLQQPQHDLQKHNGVFYKHIHSIRMGKTETHPLSTARSRAIFQISQNGKICQYFCLILFENAY